MNIQSAKYVADIDGNNSSITTTINDSTISVPLDTKNRHYVAIMKKVEAGTLTIEPADEPSQEQP